MKLNLKIWRQEGKQSKGRFVDYSVDNISEEASFLEMLDTLNESLVSKNLYLLPLIMIVEKEFAVCVP